MVESKCSSCGGARSWLGYSQFCGVAGGIIGSLIGFTLFDIVGALAGGLLGIVVMELGARLVLRSRSLAVSNRQGDSR